MSETLAIDIPSILPHRYPFLLVDAFVSQEGDSFECLKKVSYNEPFFQGHFPQEPVMPGVLIIEALAQASGVAIAAREGTTKSSRMAYFAGIDKARFKRKVVPGDILRLTGTITAYRRKLCKVKAVAYVGDEVAAEAELALMFAE